MRIVVLASGEFAVPTLRWLARSEHEVPLLVTQPARPGGRGRQLTPTPARLLAGQLELKTLEVENINAVDVIHTLRSLPADLGLAIAFGQKLGPQVMQSARHGYVNLHASLLPKYRGAAPINWAIVRGEARTGCTVFRMVETMDAGPILTSRCTEIKPEETAGELHERLAGIGVDAVRAAIDLFDKGGDTAGSPQDESQVTLAPKLRKSDGNERFDRSAAEIARHVLGMTPWPGAACMFRAADGRWEKVNLIRVRVAEDPSPTKIPPGTIDDRRYVAASDRFLEVLEIQPSSKRIMTWAEYVNGRHVRAGDSLSSGQA